MLNCDKRLQPETRNPSGLHENVFANPRSTLESLSLQIPCQGTHPFVTSTATGQAPALISPTAPGTVSLCSINHEYSGSVPPFQLSLRNASLSEILRTEVVMGRPLLRGTEDKCLDEHVRLDRHVQGYAGGQAPERLDVPKSSRHVMGPGIPCCGVPTLEKCCELCTVLCAREKCASARVQVIVVSAPPVALTAVATG